MHWCLAVVDFSVPGVYYYDSMGGNNRACLEALCEYLQKEHEDKKKAPYSTDDFQVSPITYLITLINKVIRNAILLVLQDGGQTYNKQVMSFSFNS